jgi:hypothetical protein
MAWRISEQEFLIKGKSYPIYLSLSVNRVKLPDGSLINSAHEYFRVAADGAILKWYCGPSSSTLEECLYVINIYSVMQTSFFEFSWTEGYGRAPELQQKVWLHDLELIAEDRLPFDPARVVEGFHFLQTGKPGGDK